MREASDHNKRLTNQNHPAQIQSYCKEGYDTALQFDCHKVPLLVGPARFKNKQKLYKINIRSIQTFYKKFISCA